MNATLLRPAPAAGTPREAGDGQRRAVLALARVEALRLLRHPITIVAVLFMVGVWVSEWFTNESNQYPVLQDMDRETQLGMMLLLGGAALVAGNLAVLRAHRHGTNALGDVLVLPYRARTVAHLLAVLPLGLLAVVLVALRIGALALAPAAGHPNVFELATGPAVVVLFGAIGVLLGRLTRSAIVAPLMLLALLAILVVIPLVAPIPGSPVRWFQPVVAESEAPFVLPAPVYLMARPAGPHLVYLVGLALLVAVAALARGGARSLRLLGVGVVALALTAAGAVGQAGSVSKATTDARLAAMQYPAKSQTCRSLGTVTYCAFPDFTGWIPSWDTEVHGVLARVPAALAAQPLAVRQRVVLMGPNNAVPSSPGDTWQADDTAAGTPNAVTVTTRWGDSRSASVLTALVAFRVVTGSRMGAGSVCGARGVLIGWLSGQASGLARTGLRKLVDDQDTREKSGVFFAEATIGAGILVPHREITMAMSLLDRPANEVGARVLASWDELASSRTTIERAAEILGMPSPPPASSDDQQAGPKQDGDRGCS